MVGRDGFEPPTRGFSVLGARSGKRRNRRGIKRFPSGPPRTKAYLLVGFHWVCVASLDVGGQSPGRRLIRSEEHTSELQSLAYLVCRLLLEKKKNWSKRSENQLIIKNGCIM